MTPIGTKVKIQEVIETKQYLQQFTPSKVGLVVETGALAKDVQLGLCIFVPDDLTKIDNHYYIDKNYVFSAL